MRVAFFRALFGALLTCAAAHADTPADREVAVVLGPSAPEIERYAAGQLCEYLGKLYGLQTKPVTQLPARATVGLLLGSPDTNPAVKEALGATGWPKVSDQGIVLKRAKLQDKPVLAIGGSSPRATLWAVYELVERWGVRYLLHGDILPEQPGPFHLPDRDAVLEPSLPMRQWRVINDFAMGPESWGLADYQPVLDQLAKLKFNRIFVCIYPWQPFLDLKHGRIQRKEAWLWYDFHYPITGDMPGRKLFGNAPEFWNPDLPRGASYRAFAAAGEKHLRGLMAHAKSRGFQVAMVANIGEFPREFAPLLKDHRIIYASLGNLTVTPGPKQPMEDPALLDLAAAVVKTTVNTYPDVDFVVPQMPEISSWTDQYERAWRALDAKYALEAKHPLAKMVDAARQRRGYAAGPERAVTEVKANVAALYLIDKLFAERKVLARTKRPDAVLAFSSMAEELLPVLPDVLPAGSETLNLLDYTPERIVARPQAFRGVRSDRVKHGLIFTLHDDNVGVLPQLNTGSLAKLVGHMRAHGWAGFSTRYWLLGDHDGCVAYLARTAWQEGVTPEAVYRDQVRAVCGEAAVPDMLEVFATIEAVTRELNNHGLGLTFPVPGMITKHLQPGPLSEPLVRDRAGYRRALAAAQRALAKCSERGKPYVASWIGRLEFGIGYLDCIESTRQLAQAKAALRKSEEAGDSESAAKRRAEATKRAAQALKLCREMLEAFARVARDQSDRGALATMAEYVYRPLNTEADQLGKGGK